ncbi:hypothetical protein FS837_013027 [Tulasnella sp. UAMH 9824]|nr:hypothetical protein FS837_013027 [Tulasnella sp. UAMH 9824]
MTEYLSFGGTDGHTSVASTASDVAGPASLKLIDTILPPASGHQPTLPLELLIGIVEWLATAPDCRSFLLGNGSLGALVSLGLANRTLNGMVTPVLYRRIRLTTSEAIQLFHNTLSNLPRGTYLSTFVRYFFAYDKTDQSTARIQDIVTLIRDVVEYIHIDKWPGDSPASDLRDRLASVRNLRQLSINKGQEAVSPTIHLQNLSTLQSIVLDGSNVAGMVSGVLSDALEGGRNRVVGHNLTIYCVVDGVLPCYLVMMMVGARLQQFLLTGTELPLLRIVMFFIETSTLPTQLLQLSLEALQDRWFCLPVSVSFQNLDTVEFQQWLRNSIEDGSLWDANLVPMGAWAARAGENVGQPVDQDAPSVAPEPYTSPN